MLDLPYESYVWVKALHVVAVTGWGGGLIAATQCLVLSADGETPAVWVGYGRRLLARLANPSMVLAIFSGGLLTMSYGDLDEAWLHAKFAAVWLMLVFHLRLFLWSRRHEQGLPLRQGIARDVLKVFPIGLFIGIVVLVVVRPF